MQMFMCTSQLLVTASIPHISIEKIFKAPSHARLRQLVTWPVKVGNSLSLSDWFKRAGWWCMFLNLRGWQGCRLWIRGGLIWALSVLSLDFLRQVTTSLLTVLWFCVYWRKLLQGWKLWWTTYSIPSWWGWGVKLLLCFMLLEWR